MKNIISNLDVLRSRTHMTFRKRAKASVFLFFSLLYEEILIIRVTY